MTALYTPQERSKIYPTMRSTLAILALSLAACGASDDDTADPTPDAGAAVRVDAKPGAVEQPVTCTKYTRTITTGSTVQTTTNSIATFPAIHKGDEFLVEQCDPYGVPLVETACPSNGTCSGSIFPPGAPCAVTRSVGTFVGDALTVQCGSTSDAGGGRLDYGYRTIRVTKL